MTRTSNMHDDPPPILFVPGLFHGAWCYEEHFVPWFRARGYMAEAVRFRRDGQHRAPGLRTMSIKDFAADVGVTAARMPSAPVLVGHSMGGFTIQKYLEDHDAPAVVLLASAPPYGILSAALREGARHPARMLAAVATLSVYGLIKTPDRARALFFSDGLAEQLVRKYQAEMTDDSFRVFLELMGFIRPDVKKINSRGVPMLVVRGDEDRSITWAYVADTARIYGAEIHRFPGQAHDLMLEPDWEKVAERIDSFVRAKTTVAMAV
ncbi:MAG TPA: alpha/beta fold hydrolase [Candidatus Dormibacteraeota bacterium]|nr:alpha/beta fold hydrolase [Candidatus Dormibacteraeota bacterium]